MEKSQGIVRCSLCGKTVEVKGIRQYNAKCESCKKKIASRQGTRGKGVNY